MSYFCVCAHVTLERELGSVTWSTAEWKTEKSKAPPPPSLPVLQLSPPKPDRATRCAAMIEDRGAAFLGEEGVGEGHCVLCKERALTLVSMGVQKRKSPCEGFVTLSTALSDLHSSLL